MLGLFLAYQVGIIDRLFAAAPVWIPHWAPRDPDWANACAVTSADWLRARALLLFALEPPFKQS